MNLKELVARDQKRLRKQIETLADAEAKVDHLISTVRHGTSDFHLLAAKNALYQKKRELERHPILRPLSKFVRSVLGQIARTRAKGGWYWPSMRRDAWSRQANRYLACEELAMLGLVKQKTRYLAYKITDKGRRWLKELG